jgi:hypothetical protein
MEINGLEMLRTILIAVAISQAIGSVPVFAQGRKVSKKFAGFVVKAPWLMRAGSGACRPARQITGQQYQTRSQTARSHQNKNPAGVPAGLLRDLPMTTIRSPS